MRKRTLKTVVDIVAHRRSPEVDEKTGFVTFFPLKEEKLTYREALKIAFEKLGGSEGFSEWAARNPSEFYNQMVRTLPLEITGKDGGPVGVVFIDPTDPRTEKAVAGKTLPGGEKPEERKPNGGNDARRLESQAVPGAPVAGDDGRKERSKASRRDLA